MEALNSQKEEEPAATNALSDQLKQMPTQELQQIMSALPQEIKSRQDASLGSAHEVSVVLQTLLREGKLRTSIPKLPAFSGEMAKGVSFEQWSYELLTLRKSYSDSALRVGIHCFLRGATAATRIEGLLSQIRDRFPNQLPHKEEQRLLKDCLFHGSRKSIKDSIKYCFADTSVDYMHFIEECRKSEEDGEGWPS